MSYNRSRVYNSQTLSQSRKMSIGMTAVDLVDKPLKKDNTNPIDNGNQKCTSSMIGFVEGKQARHSSHLLSSNQAVLEHVSDAENMETTRVISGKEGNKDVASVRCGEFLHRDKQDADEVEKRNKEALRMKLQLALLGTFPSAMNNKHADDNARVMREVVASENGNANQVKHRQNSDAIETDSDKAEKIVRRPVTRSLRAKKKAPAKMRSLNLKSKSVSRNYKEENNANHVFYFGCKSAPAKPREENLAEKFANVKQSCGMKPVEVEGVHHVSDAVNFLLNTTGDKELPSREELTLEGGITSARNECLHENVEPEAAKETRNLDRSPSVREKAQPQNADSPISLEASDHYGSPGNQFPVHHDDHLSSPLFKMSKTLHKSPMTHQVCDAVQAEGRKPAQFRCSPATEENTESSDDAATSQEIHANTPKPSAVDNSKQGQYTPEGRESDSSEEVSSAKKVSAEHVPTSPETGFMGKHIFSCAKRHCSNGIDHSYSSPTIESPKASAYIDDELMESSEGSPEDEFARAVSLLGLALQRVKTKMMSVTDRRCSEILTSAAEEIQLQLRNFEAQIQADLVKLTSLTKSKRKLLETSFQEQQDNLKVIFEKFKKEIHQYIQDSKGATEAMEAQQMELKGAIQRQKISHKKLLLQAEAAVETQLNDAQRQITSVRKMGRQKLLRLKLALAETLKDGTSS